MERLIDANYIAALDERAKLFQEMYKSAGDEFDKQVVYLSGGGLVLTIGFVKDIVKLSATAFLPFLLLSWILFAATLLLNLWSHKASATSTDLFLSQVHYLKEQHLAGLTPEPGRLTQLEGAALAKRRLVETLNSWCVWLSVSGVLSFIIFTAINIIFHAAFA
jgi:hypothetical protein